MSRPLELYKTTATNQCAARVSSLCAVAPNRESNRMLSMRRVWFGVTRTPSDSKMVSRLAHATSWETIRLPVTERTCAWTTRGAARLAARVQPPRAARYGNILTKRGHWARRRLAARSRLSEKHISNGRAIWLRRNCHCDDMRASSTGRWIERTRQAGASLNPVEDAAPGGARGRRACASDRDGRWYLH
jgi:hypothetical protein